MNPKPNDSQAEVNDNDIVIDENIGNNKPDVVEGVTAEPNYETPERKQSFFSTKKGKKVLFGIIGVVLLVVLIIILVILLKPCKGPDCSPCEGPYCSPCEGPDCPCEGPYCSPCEGPDCPIFEINYTKNDVYIYEETLSKESKINLRNNDIINGRRLDESKLSQNTIIKSNYVINIYDFSDDIYYAYAGIIDINKAVDNKDSKSLGGKDIRNINDADNKTPVAKFSFTKYGEIKSFEVSSNIDSLLASYLYQFVEQVIPEVSKSSFSSRRLNEERTYDGNSNSGTIIDIRPPVNPDADNKEERRWETQIEKRRVKKVEGKKIFSLIANNERQLSGMTSNFTKDIETDQNVNRGSQIKNISNLINSIISYKNESNDETLTNKISNLLNNVSFKKYEGERRLNIIPTELYNLRNLQDDRIDTYAHPLYFNYPIFKTNLLGAKIGVMANVVFLPMDGSFKMEMFFDANGHAVSIFKEESYTNFDIIIDQIRKITKLIYILIVEKDSKIPDVLAQYKNEIKAQLNTLNSTIQTHPHLNDEQFTQELRRILLKVNETVATTFQETYQSSNTATIVFNELLLNIEDGNEEFSTSIKQTSSSAIETFINTNKVNLEKLFTAWNTFYDEAIPQLEVRKKEHDKNKSLIFDIGLYYNIKDEMKAIIKVYEEFANNLKNSVTDEKIRFKSAVNEKYKSIVYPKLMEAEKISESAQNNVSVIDAMRTHFQNGEGDTIRTNMINEINNLRNILENVKEEILSQISIIYSNNIESESFKLFEQDLRTKLTTIESQQITIIEYLEEFNIFDKGFDTYFEDIKLLNELEISVNNAKRTIYKIYIGDYLYGLSDYFLTEKEVTEIKTTIKNYFKVIGEHLDKIHFTDAIIESENIVSIVKEINKKYLTNTLSQRIINYYSNQNFLTSMLDKYFDSLTEAYKVFNTSFFDKNYVLHRPDYVSKPTELINKLLDISYNIKPEISNLHRTIQDLIETKITLGISSTSIQIYQIIFEEYNTLIQSIYNKKCCINGYDSANVEIIKNNLKKFIDIYIDKNGKFIQTYNYSRSTKEDEFNLKTIINQKINIIVYNIRRIVDQINIDFHDTFCYGVQVYCAFINVVSQIEHYYYQASKLRVSLSFLQSLVNISQNMITTEKILVDLDPENYAQLFVEELTYKRTEIITDINTFLSELNVNTTKYINSTLITLKTDIKTYFESGLLGIEAKIKDIASGIFIDPEVLVQELYDYIYYACGPASKIMLAFNQEIEFHKLMAQNKYTFNQEQYKRDYNQMEIELNNLVNEQKQLLFNNLKVPELLITELKRRVIDFINESYQTISEKVNSLTTLTKFEFLNMEFSLKDIISNALTEVSNNFTSRIETTVRNEYNNALTALKNKIKKNIQKDIQLINDKLNVEYNGAFSYYSKSLSTFGKNTSVSYTYEVVLQQSTIEQVFAAYKIFFVKIKETYSEENLKSLFVEKQKEVLKNYTFEFKYQNYSEIILKDIKEISALSYDRFIQEKSLFQSQIKIFYEQAFRKIIVQFINGKGRDYISYAINFDYENTIYHDFTLMKTAINQTYYTVKTLLDVAELKSLGYLLIQSFKNVYKEVRSDINNTIPSKIESVIYPKIETFRDIATTSVANLYIQSLEKESDSIKQKFSSKVADLIPSRLGSAFKGIIEDIFNKTIHDLIQEIKNSYNTKILEDLKIVIETLQSQGKEVSEAVASTNVLETSDKWASMERYYNKLKKVHNQYNKDSEFNVENEKTVKIESLIKNKIIPYLEKITTSFYFYTKQGQEQLKEVLKVFKVNSLKDSTLTEITNWNKASDISAIRLSIERIFGNFKSDIISKFDNLKTEFEEESEEYEIEGFSKTSSSRNLEEYDLNQIESALEGIEKKIKNFTTQIRDSPIYSDIIGSKETLVSNLYSEASKLTNNFYPYQVLISQYTDNEKIKDYFNELEIEALSIRNKTIEFSSEISEAIDNTMLAIETGRINSWPHIRESLNSKIYTMLDTVFSKKFDKLKDYSINKDKEKLIITVPNIEVPGEDGVTLTTYSFDIKDINVKYGFSLKRNGIYDFKMEIYSGGNITLDVKTKVEERITEIISGKLGSGLIGINADYILHDKSLNYEAYAKINDVNYTVTLMDNDNNIIREVYPEDKEKYIPMKKTVTSTYQSPNK